MPLPGARASALLNWVNGVRVCPDPIKDLTELRDGTVFLGIINQLHHSEEGEAVLGQPLPERISFIRGFLQKHSKHKSTTDKLVPVQKLLEGDELALAKVAVLLLYQTSMSCKNPGDWNQFDYQTQVELASILKFVLDNEESLHENLEPFLQRKAPTSAGGGSEEPSPLSSVPQKREVRFLELQRIASSSSSSSSSSSNNAMPGTPSSPMGDVMQTPQFQLRRLKKQLAMERDNRDELEVELAEHRKLLTEKEAQITMMQQRIDRLALLSEKQTTDEVEPKEMEELREKNESLLVRLHEALKQCQDLKTEKVQMDRKINQLSEENGDLSFKLREIGSHMVQLQEALNELSEEHNAALAQSQEKQGQLESDLRVALQDKKCCEEKIEILQGKISLLEDQLAQLAESSTQEKGEVMGDVLKLEELKQEVSSLTAQGTELQATVLRLEEEKQQREVTLAAERSQFEEEKQQLSGLICNLHSSLAESRGASERLEQELRAQVADAEARCQQEVERSSALSARHEVTLQEKDCALRQLQELRESNAVLTQQLQSKEAEQGSEKARFGQQIAELEAKLVELSAQQAAAEGLRAQLRELEGRLKETQQKLVEREKAARENMRLQERLLFLEESLRNTEGILEDEKRRAAESLETSLARIAELEAEKQRLVQGPREEDENSGAKAAAAAAELQALSREQGQRLQAEQERAAALEAQLEHLGAQHQEKLGALQAELASARAQAVEKQLEEEKLKAEVATLRERMAAAEQLASQRAARLEEETRRAAEVLEGVAQQLQQEQLKCKELEGAGRKQRELELEVQKLVGELELLGSRLEESQQELGRRSEETERLRHEADGARASCAAQRGRAAELEVQLQNTLNEQRVERTAHHEELRRVQELLQQKDVELEELHRGNATQGEELRELQETVRRLQGELDDVESKRSEEPHRSEEGPGLQEKLQEETQLLRSQLEELERKSQEQQEAAAALERAAAAERAELESSRKELAQQKEEVAQQKEKVVELQKLLESSRLTHDGALETLRKELQEKSKELLQSKAAAEKELATLRTEKGRSEDTWKDQLAQCVQELERKSSLVGSLEHEVSIVHRQLLEKEGESKELKRLIVAESEKSKKLEERLRVLQSEMATAASRAAERCSLMKVEVQRCQEEMEKQRSTLESLRRERHSQGEREDELRHEVKLSQERCLQKEQLVATLQQELASAQAVAAELPALKHLCQQLQAERAALERDVEQRAEAAATLQAELARATEQVAEAATLRERWAEQERELQRLQVTVAERQEELLRSQQANAQLAQEKRGLQRLEAELGQVRELHAQELQRLRVAAEELQVKGRREAEEAEKKLEEMSKEQERGRVAAQEERKRLQEERKRLVEQVEQLEVLRKDQAKQMEELNKKLVQQEKATKAQQQKVKALEGELQAEATRQRDTVADLKAQLAQKEQAAEHYKGQMEKAKTHYDAKKQQNQDLAEKVKALELLQRENKELRGEAERLAKELDRSSRQLQESEKSCRNLSGQVRSLEAQVELANRQLQDLGKLQVPPEAPKNLRPFRQNPADLSTDSLDLSLDEAPQLNSTRKTSRSQPEASEVPPAGDGEGSPSGRLPRKVESLESLYFTPIPGRTGSRLEGSVGSIGDLSLGSGCRTRSARRRTTINITMSTKQPQLEDSNSSFSSVPPVEAPRTRRTSSRSLGTFSSQEPETSSPQEPPGQQALRGLPGYRPLTRSSLRHLQASTSSSSLVSLGQCQEEPEPEEDWGRIAELQQRNQSCPPHLKTCYPLESRPSIALGTITDEEMKTGDPQETLRRASMQPVTRRSTLATTGLLAWPSGATGGGGITTRQQRKRLSDESHQGPDTPQSKKPTSCFPRPQTPRDRSRRSEQLPPSKQPQRRQSLAFSILNTPKKLGSSLLRRAATSGPKSTPKGSPRTGTRRSPRGGPTKSPRGKAGRRALKDTKF